MLRPLKLTREAEKFGERLKSTKIWLGRVFKPVLSA
jgi:hypothetical protein